MNELLELPDGLEKPENVCEKDRQDGLQALSDVRARVLELGMAIFEGSTPSTPPTTPVPKTRIHPTFVGASSELLVCSDLLRAGYEVFRSVSLNCSCDLVAMKDGEIIRVECKTGYKKQIPSADRKKYDVLAAVTPEGITYHPALP
jgi:hypothetical protein